MWDTPCTRQVFKLTRGPVWNGLNSSHFDGHLTSLNNSRTGVFKPALLANPLPGVGTFARGQAPTAASWHGPWEPALQAENTGLCKRYRRAVRPGAVTIGKIIRFNKMVICQQVGNRGCADVEVLRRILNGRL